MFFTKSVCFIRAVVNAYPSTQTSNNQKPPTMDCAINAESHLVSYYALASGTKSLV